MANAIQRSQLPRLFPPFPNRHEFNLFATMKPAKEVGGDFYDFFMVDHDHVALVMADVSGKGVPAALFMMVTRMLIKSRIQSGESPSEALTNVNRQLCESNELGFFVTAWLAVLEISTGKGVAVNAGHEHPALRRSGGQYELVLYRHSLALAALDGVQFKQHEFQLYPGDSFFVYTDGVAEATNGEKALYGTDRMLAALNADPEAPPERVLENLTRDINRFVDGAEQFDDITMLSFLYHGPTGRPS
jgi:sigma-B regulation protein RsbU (phosphoserine phosphatase)